MTDVFISIDMEGVAGVAHSQQVLRGSDDFAVGRRLMAGEANAAIAGAYDAGATRVVVNDSHGDMYNLVPDAIDERATLIIGSPKLGGSMVESIETGFDVALFIGYHALAGTTAAVLDHTYSGRAFHDVRLNGASVTEAELNAAVAGSYGVPVGLVTGDDKICAHVASKLQGVRTVEVKRSLGRQVAASMSPPAACAAIREGATAAVAGAGDLRPYVPDAPYVFEIVGRNSLVAELCALAPGSERTDARTVTFETDDFRLGFRCLLAWMYLGAAAP